ncbi:15704_t:CDS:2 [Gigaspora margarita]|uniref:15704_t:CDS:1 n=1 Tax=Gigaspora margarita TaxID=4874 RepID=A0ABN7VW92_GIGMA|nr:15704_t:CDS:2 [Gigaspora margarita]
MSETQDACLGAAEIIADTATEILAVYFPIVSTISTITKRIYDTYHDAECNKQICEVLAKRVKNAEGLIDKIIKDIGGNQEKFRQRSYYLAFKHYENTLKNIEEFTEKVSKYKGFIKYFTSKVTKERLKSLTEDYDTCMRDLHFTMYVTNEQDRKEEAQMIEESLNDTLKKLDIGVDNINQRLDVLVQSIDLIQSKIDQSNTDNPRSNVQAQRIDHKELSSPHVQTDNDIRDNGNIIKKFLNNTIEVACKSIKDFNNSESELAILGKFSHSPYIVRFYGLTNFDNCDFMVLDWAEYGTLRDVYCKYDIPWTRKIKILRNICRGLVYLRSVNIFHHDLRCKNVLVREDLEPRLGNFKRSRVIDGPTRNLGGILVDVVHWMAPELLEKYQDLNTEKRNEQKYTFHCEVFSFGMLIWELCYEKIPYDGWNIQKISDHVLSGQREKLLRGKFKKEVDKTIQEEFIKIIEKTWQQVPYQRIEIAKLDKKLEKLSVNYPIPIDEPLLEKNETLDFEGGDKDEPVFYKNLSEKSLFVEYKQLNSSTIIPFEEGIEYHKKKNHTKAWECFKENAEIGNKEAKFWKGYYLTHGYGIVTPDPEQAMKLFKEAADYADHKNSDAMYSLGDIYFNGKLRVEKNEQLGLEYLKSAASLENDKALFFLGDIYLNGKFGLEKNEQRGLGYLKSAAKFKNEKAISILQGLQKTEIPIN